MAFIVLRRSRNTRSYYLVESYRNGEGKTCRKTLCYLGRELDGTDTLAKALAHWVQVRAKQKKELRKAKGERRQVMRRRIEGMGARIGVITEHMQILARVEAERRKREQHAEEALYWQSFDRLRRSPTEENAKEAKRAFLFLAKRSCGSRTLTTARTPFGAELPGEGASRVGGPSRVWAPADGGNRADLGKSSGIIYAIETVKVTS
jgi:hypothetical protein